MECGKGNGVESIVGLQGSTVVTLREREREREKVEHCGKSESDLKERFHSRSLQLSRSL